VLRGADVTCKAAKLPVFNCHTPRPHAPILYSIFRSIQIRPGLCNSHDASSASVRFSFLSASWTKARMPPIESTIRLLHTPHPHCIYDLHDHSNDHGPYRQFERRSHSILGNPHHSTSISAKPISQPTKINAIMDVLLATHSRGYMIIILLFPHWPLMNDVPIDQQWCARLIARVLLRKKRYPCRATFPP